MVFYTQKWWLILTTNCKFQFNWSFR